MYLTPILAVLAALGNVVQSASTNSQQTCSFVIAKHNAGKVQCLGRVGAPDESIAAQNLLSTTPVVDMPSCAAVCKENSECKSFAFIANAGTCFAYKRNVAHLNLITSSASNSSAAFYDASCFNQRCTKVVPISSSSSSTSSSFSPLLCTATAVTTTTLTSYTSTVFDTVTAVAYTTLDPALATSVATNYIVNNVTSYDIGTTTKTIHRTSTSLSTTTITSTSTLVDVFNTTATSTTFATQTSSLYYTLSVVNNLRKLPNQCSGMSANSTVTVVATQTNLAVLYNATTTTITITNTPAPVTSTISTDVTTNVAVETQTADIIQTSFITTTTVIATTIGSPNTTISTTATFTTTAAATSTSYAVAPALVCPASDGLLYNMQNSGTDYYFQIECNSQFTPGYLVLNTQITPDFITCINGCAQQVSQMIAMRNGRKVRRGIVEMECEAVLYNNNGTCNQVYSYNGISQVANGTTQIAILED